MTFASLTFFLFLPLAIPHLSIQVPEESLAEYEGVIPETDYPDNMNLNYLEHPSPRAAYAAMVSHVDRDVGKIRERVEQLGLDENTIIIFSSDNGPVMPRAGGSDSNASPGRSRSR